MSPTPMRAIAQRYNEWLAHNELELAIDGVRGAGDENVATMRSGLNCLYTFAENMGVAKTSNRYKKIFAK